MRAVTRDFLVINFIIVLDPPEIASMNKIEPEVTAADKTDSNSCIIM